MDIKMIISDHIFKDLVSTGQTIDLSHSELFQVVTKGVNFSDIFDLQSTNFTECTFEECNFSGTILAFSKFTRCKFINCNFTMAAFGSKIRECLFSSCNLKSTGFTSVDCTNTVFKDCDWAGAYFVQGNFENVDFSENLMQEMDIVFTVMIKCKFSRVCLNKSYVKMLNINCSDLVTRYSEKHAHNFVKHGDTWFMHTNKEDEDNFFAVDVGYVELLNGD